MEEGAIGTVLLSIQIIWGIVKIMVPFWVPKIRPRIIIGTQKGTIISTVPHIGTTTGTFLHSLVASSKPSPMA